MVWSYFAYGQAFDTQVGVHITQDYDEDSLNKVFL